MRLRWRPTARLVPSEQGLAVHTERGAFRLDGSDLVAVVERLLPALDGGLDADGLAARLPEFSRDSVVGLLDLLLDGGAVETVGSLGDGNPDGASRVLVLGAGSAAEAARSGLADGRPGIEVVDVAAPRFDPSGELVLPDVPVDLAVAVGGAGDLALHLGLARAGQRLGLANVSVTNAFDEYVVGPVVLPGVTACWNCYRHRRAAARRDPQLAMATLAGAAPPAPLDTASASLLGSLAALELVAWMSEPPPALATGRVLVFDVATRTSSRHQVVRLPWCEVCGGAGGRWGFGAASEGDRRGRPAGEASARFPDPGDPAALRAQLAGWVDDHTGVVRTLRVDGREPDEPALPVTATAEMSWWADPARGPDHAAGKGLTATAAMLGAFGEALERYCASRARPDDLRWARLGDLPGEEVFDPRRLGLYDDAQLARPDFPHVRFDADRPLWWATGWWVPSWRPALLPALAVHIDLPVTPADDFVQVTSNGLGAGVSAAAAAHTAALELIERDALMISWLTRRPGRRLLVDDSLGVAHADVVDGLRGTGAEFRLLQLTAGADVPVVACIGRGDGTRWPAVSVSVSAGSDLVQAARGAVLEQGHVGPNLRRALRSGHRAPARAEAVRSTLDHALFYAVPGRQDELAFWFDGPGEAVPLGEACRQGGEPVDTVDECGRRLAAAGVQLAVADVTTPDVRSGPWRVFRALGAGAQSIHFGWGMERRSNPRLAALATGPINAMPHPFA